jgi:hypothetical protein
MKILLSYLIYGNGYLEQFDIHLQSLLLTTNIDDYDFMFITNKTLVSKIKKLMKKHNILNNVIFNIQPNIIKRNNLREYLEKLLVLKFNVMDLDISNYDRVLLGDVDVLVIDDLHKITHINGIKNNCFYGITEDNASHTCPYWYLYPYTNQQLKFLDNNKILPLNSGHILFVPSKENKVHFDNMKNIFSSITDHNKKFKQHKIKYFYDQSIYNFYINLNKLNNSKKLQNTIKLFPNNNTNYNNQFVLLHFTGISKCDKKIKNMTNYLNKYVLKN